MIFQAPTLSHIVDTRINNSIFFQKKAFEVIQSASDILYPTKVIAAEQDRNAAGEAGFGEPQDDEKNNNSAAIGACASETHELDFIFEAAEAPLLKAEL